MSTNLTFDESAAEFVLESFDREVDDEGYIINSETGERETTPEGDELTVDDLAGIEQGSKIFVADEFTSIVEHVKRRRNKADA
jgi:hypothetical protein